MEFRQVVNKRRMVRSFEYEKIPRERLERVCKTGLQGPSAGFSQGIEWLVLDKDDELQEFWGLCTTKGFLEKSTNHRGLKNAGAVLLLLADQERYIERYRMPDKRYSLWQGRDAWPTPYWFVDAGAAMVLSLLEAVNQDLGALFFAVDRGVEEIRNKFAIPSSMEIVGAIALGRPARAGESTGSPTRIRRREITEVVHFGHYGGS